MNLLRTPLGLGCLLALVACPRADHAAGTDTGALPDTRAPDTADSADSADSGETGDSGVHPPECDASTLTAYAPVPVATFKIAPSSTARDGESIDDTLQGTYKEHYIQRRDDGGPDREELFLWLGGSGSEPQNYDYILNMAAFAGYTSVSLAYDNETSVGDTCGHDDVPECSSANVDCEEQVREEMIYGVDTSPCLAVTPENSIEHRVLRLLQYGVEKVPTAGFDRYLDASKQQIDWTHIAVGGWSQGGGHAGMLSRDHLVARALFVSKGAGSVACTDVMAETDCDLDGDGVVGRDNLDEYVVPAPWAYDERFTPPSREFGSIHMEEDAWYYSDETYAAFGMDGAEAPLLIDGVGPYPEAYTDAYGCTHVFATDATPSCGDNDFHKSMASDFCMALDDDGVPLLAPAYVYALTVPVD